MTVPTATIAPAPERERHARQDRDAHETPARGPRPHEPEPRTAQQPVLLAGEDEDACREEPHIWRGID
ncbi:hypothetical protein [Streptomyces capitiformicae]|uniref:Uncharacterized protein n=1 Tax=Streptomyces capitiformicae TaxID=2014920 RepID=A0A919GAG1_9ACTN|nr:hypothetical protein [Streptomyces capitiformicae]GHH80568.1 hypothetical protein GCM10017771_00210 [Streptomyces capitiformicae]